MRALISSLRWAQAPSLATLAPVGPSVSLLRGNATRSLLFSTSLSRRDEGSPPEAPSSTSALFSSQPTSNGPAHHHTGPPPGIGTNQPAFRNLQRELRPAVNRYSIDMLDSTVAPGEITPYVLNVHAGLNNTIISLTNASGAVLINTSGGSVGFKKAQRAGYEAAYQAMEQLIKKAQEKGIVVQNVHIKFKGFGMGRDASFKALRSLTNWRVVRLSDCTPIPFNGCRPRKQRRL